MRLYPKLNAYELCGRFLKCSLIGIPGIYSCMADVIIVISTDTTIQYSPDLLYDQNGYIECPFDGLSSVSEKIWLCRRTRYHPRYILSNKISGWFFYAGRQCVRSQRTDSHSESTLDKRTREVF